MRGIALALHRTVRPPWRVLFAVCWCFSFLIASIAGAEELHSPGGADLSLGYQRVGPDLVVGGDIVIEPGWRDSDGRIDTFGTTGQIELWPDGVIPFAIHASVSRTHRKYIKSAIAEFEDKTFIRWVRRDGEDAFVQFIELDDGPCRAEPGYTGGRRRIKLRKTSTCNQGVVTHEMGHVVGLLHEQNRRDAMNYVRNLGGCLDSSGSRAIGDFDICSTMLYRSTTLGSCNIKLRPGTTSDDCPRSEQCPGSEPCRLQHDWSTLSNGDVATIASLYGPAEEPEDDEPPEAMETETSSGLMGGCAAAATIPGWFVSALLALCWLWTGRQRRRVGRDDGCG